MSNIPAELNYTESHEWVRDEGEGVVRIGISDHAQEELGDLVFVELPQPGDEIDRGDSCAVVESVKAASDIYAPLTGEVVAVNEELEDDPGIINNDAYGDGWLFTLRISDNTELDELLDAEAYTESIEQ